MIPYNLPQRGNIQGFWRMEADGGNEPDLSGNGYTLVETSGTIPTVPGIIGNARDFELGDSEYFTIAHASCSNLQITGEITISMCLKPESISAQYILCKSGASGNRGYITYLAATGEIGFVLSSNGTAQVTATSNTQLIATNWYHVAATLNQVTNEMQVYIDGSSDGAAESFTTDINNSTEDFFLGSYYNGAVNYDGIIDELIVWNKCLTPAEILRVKNITAYPQSAFLLNMME